MNDIGSYHNAFFTYCYSKMCHPNGFDWYLYCRNCPSCMAGVLCAVLGQEMASYCLLGAQVIQAKSIRAMMSGYHIDIPTISTRAMCCAGAVPMDYY